MTIVDLTQRRRWKSQATETEKAREPPSRIDSEPEYRADLDSEAALAEIRRLASLLRHRHGAEVEIRLWEAVTSM